MKYSWLKSFFFPLLVVWTSWVAVRQSATHVCRQQKHRQLFFFPPFLRGFVWTRAMQLFTALVGNHHHGFYLSSPALLICGCKRKRQREGPGESGRKMACGLETSRHCPPFPPLPFFSLPLLSLSFSACLGCLPFSFALITAFVKKKQKKKTVSASRNSFDEGSGCVCICNLMDFIGDT